MSLLESINSPIVIPEYSNIAEEQEKNTLK